MRGVVIIHGHFYQPPRENPWTGQVDVEPSAAPDHDWNARVTRESYLPLVSVAIDDNGKKSQIPVYEYLSFDFGSTLLDWMERQAPEIYDAVLRADRASVQRLGHGNALAMRYHHIILPLASRRDKEVEVRWGIADFKKRFGRDPIGLWLPETAVDHETLDVIVRAGIAFTGLAPDANRWTEALGGTPPSAIASIAVDGETWGHHHKGGDKALATVLSRLQRSDKLELSNFAAALAAHPPAETA